MTIEVSDLLAQREDFGDRVPLGVRFLTLGVDCQDDQLVGLITGWSEREEAWLIGVAVFTGDPGTDAPWAELRELLATRFPAADGGAHRIIATLVDSGGTSRIGRIT